MGDVEDMIGTLEDEDDEEPSKKEDKKEADEEEGAFGLDLDKAWTSPQKDDG